MTTDRIPAPRPIPTREDRMTEARATATRPAFRAYLTASEVAALDAELARVRQQRDELAAHLAHALDDRDRARAELADWMRAAQHARTERDLWITHHTNQRAELGRAQEVIAEIRNNRERDDRALAMYDTRPGEAEPTAPVPSRRAQEDPAGPHEPCTTCWVCCLTEPTKATP